MARNVMAALIARVSIYWRESHQELEGVTLEQPMPTTPFSHNPSPMVVTSWTARPSVRLLLLLLSIIVTGGCEVPNFEGPQLQAPPEGFRRKPDISQDRRMFPDRTSIHFDAWFLDNWGEFTGIYINGHEGTTTLEEVAEARLWAMANPPDHPMAYGDIEVVEVDGRTGWAWMEMWRDNGLHEVRYHAAIPYDTITFTVVDMWTGDPTFKMRPDSIRAIVASFAVGRTKWSARQGFPTWRARSRIGAAYCSLQARIAIVRVIPSPRHLRGKWP